MQPINQSTQKLLGILFPILGVVLLLGAGLEGLVTYRFITLASRAEGKVVRLNAGGAHPVVQFRPAGEAAIDEFSDSGFINYAVGDQVTVLYLKDAQKSIPWTKIDTPGALWFEEIGLVGLGAVFLIVGLSHRHRHKRR